MIPLEKLRALKHGIFHASCPDGISSALILKDALPDLRVSFVKYDTEEHRNFPAEPGQVWCDFSPPKERSAEFVAAGALVLDHHSRDVVEPYGELGVFGENERLECGAWLAYTHVWKPMCEMRDYFIEKGLEAPSSKEIEHFAFLAAVRDTWAKHKDDWGPACEQAELLMFWPFDKIDFKTVLYDNEFLGRTLVHKKLESARTAVAESHRFTSSKGTRVLMFQGVAATSDAAELVEKEGYEITKTDAAGSVERGRGFGIDLVVGFHYRTETPPPDTRRRTLADRIVEGPEATIANRAFPPPRLQLQFSTRSHTGFDCQALSRAHGGNGHKAAAGFTLTEGLTGNPYETFKNVLDWWERER